MKWMWQSKPPAVTILPSPAMISVPGPMTMSIPGWMSGLPALPMARMRPSRRPISALTIPQWSRISALVMTVSAVPLARVGLRLPHAVANGLAAAELHLLAIDGEVALHLDDELGVGKPHPVADGRAEHLGIGKARDAGRHVRLARQEDRSRAISPASASNVNVGAAASIAVLCARNQTTRRKFAGPVSQASSAARRPVRSRKRRS